MELLKFMSKKFLFEDEFQLGKCTTLSSLWCIEKNLRQKCEPG